MSASVGTIERERAWRRVASWTAGLVFLGLTVAAGCVEIPDVPQSTAGGQDTGTAADAGPDAGCTLDPSACPDDGDPCTVNAVDDDCRCAHAPAPNDTSCDDQSACTTPDRCVAGVCEGTTAVRCESEQDDNPCTEHQCLPATGACAPVPVDQGGACATTDCQLPTCVCLDGTCEACDPQCDLRLCGDDSCGGSCGTCGADEGCNEETGACVPAASGMVYIEGGTFSMGSPDDEVDRNADWEQRHDVRLDPFLIDEREVTNADYLTCVTTDGAPCAPPGPCDGQAVWNPSGESFPAGLEEHPVRCVSWAAAYTYCHWLGKRLCTEAEWERACVGGAHRTFPWGDDWPQTPETHANCQTGSCHDDYAGDTAPAGTFTEGATPETAIVDLAGNVSEWVFDCFTADYETLSPDTPTGACPDQGPNAANTELRVHRGGSYDSLKGFLRCSARSQAFENPTSAVYPRTVGFRCCRDTASR